MLLLTKEEHETYCTYLNSQDDYPFDLGASVLSGSIGVRSDILAKAVKIADVFRRVCRSLHKKMISDSFLQETLLRPFDSLPILRAAVMRAPFFLTYFRMDFFLDPKKEALRVMEVNSGGAGLTDYLQCVRFLQNHHSFVAPHGCTRLDVPAMLRSILMYAEKQREIRTIGFVAVENGCDEYLWEYLVYAKWLQEHTNMQPVLLSLTNGELSLMNHVSVPCPIQSLSELDAIISDWFEDLPGLEKVQKQLNENDILTVPSRADLLFENKHFLSVVQKIDRPEEIDEKDWGLLQSSLLRSFPLEEYEEHVEEMKLWDGIVLKMDIDCASENVFIYDFSKTSFEESIQALTHTLAHGHPTSGSSLKPSWTIQEFTQPPLLPLQSSTPSWIDVDYAPYKYDLMTYLCYENDSPHVLFGSRCFAREKWDELTEEGREDGLWCPVSAL